MKLLPLIVLLALAACGKGVDPGTFHNIKPVIKEADLPAPINDLYTPAEVKMLHRGGDDYEFAGAAATRYTASQLTASVYCRAMTEGRKMGYQSWYPQVLVHQLTRVEGPRTVSAVVTFTRGPLPRGASERESKTDWCRE